METIISSRRIEWMRRIVSQLFHDETSTKGEIQQTSTRRRKVAHGDSRSNSNSNSTYKSTQSNTTTLRSSAWTALPVAMGNESFNWESCLEYNRHSPHHMNIMETVTSRNSKIKSRGEKKQTLSASSSSASSSWKVSCFLAFLGTFLIIISLRVTLNPFANAISQLQMKMQPTIEDSETGTGTSSLPIDTLTMLFLRATGMCVLLHSTLCLVLPRQLLQTSKVALLYAMAVLAAGQALTNHAIRIPCGGIAMVFWFLAGWESWATWETTTNTASLPSSPRSKSKSPTNLAGSNDNTKDMLLQYLVDDVAQTVLAVTVPLIIATLGIPHTLMEILLQQSTQPPLDNDKDEWFTTTLLLAIRLFGICQLAFAVLMMDWKDQIRQWSLSYQPLLLWLPLAQVVLVNLPLFLSLLLTLEDIRLGAFLVITQVGVAVWVIFRTVGTLQYTQSHPSYC